MITVVSSTNRKNANSHIVAKHYAEILSQKTQQKVDFFSLEQLPNDFIHSAMFSAPSEHIKHIQDEYFIQNQKFVFIIPEYNGSMPGILKVLIDALSTHRAKETFSGKKAALVGIADGRAGNLRGLEHFTAILNYLNITVMPNRQPLSAISKMLDTQKGKITDADTLKVLEKHITQFINF